MISTRDREIADRIKTRLAGTDPQDVNEIAADVHDGSINAGALRAVIEQLLDEFENLSQIAVHRDHTSVSPTGLSVYAWCVTCNARESVAGRPVDTASFAHGSTGLGKVIEAARKHLESDFHLGRPWPTIAPHNKPNGGHCAMSSLTTSQTSGDVCMCGATIDVIPGKLADGSPEAS